MLKNIIFDYGDTMIWFEPHRMAAPYICDEAEEKLFSDVFFSRYYWDRLDDGSLSRDGFVAEVTAALPPRFAPTVAAVYDHWYYHRREVAGMRELIAELKETYGRRIYLLSDICRDFEDKMRELAIFKPFDGYMLSSLIGCCKPSPRIYEALLEKYHLDPAECIFIDNREENTKGGEAVGIRGYLFDGDTAKLRAYLLAEFEKEGPAPV